MYESAIHCICYSLSFVSLPQFKMINSPYLICDTNVIYRHSFCLQFILASHPQMVQYHKPCKSQNFVTDKYKYRASVSEMLQKSGMACSRGP